MPELFPDGSFISGANKNGGRASTSMSLSPQERESTEMPHGFHLLSNPNFCHLPPSLSFSLSSEKSFFLHSYKATAADRFWWMACGDQGRSNPAQTGSELKISCFSLYLTSPQDDLWGNWRHPSSQPSQRSKCSPCMFHFENYCGITVQSALKLGRE